MSINHGYFSARGTFVRCRQCGCPMIVSFSTSQKNPGRPFFACEVGCGFVKWFDSNRVYCDGIPSLLAQQIAEKQAVVREYEMQKWTDLQSKGPEAIAKCKEDAEKNWKCCDSLSPCDGRCGLIDYMDVDIVKDSFETSYEHVKLTPYEQMF